MHLKPIDLSITPSQFNNLFVPTEGTSRIAVFGGECINGGLPLTNIKDSIEIVSVKGSQVTISANHHANDVDGGARLSLLGVMTRGALSNPSSHELRGGLLCEASYILFPEISADLEDSLSIAMILTAAVGSVL
ncbi:MAG: hypothetical protein IPJ69_12945 [Deltaproteobacteria bacterium]|nr:MAG: hypothetical protein IPJ69_12945 [Deltaproteobacteria bacterium]